MPQTSSSKTGRWFLPERGGRGDFLLATLLIILAGTVGACSSSTPAPSPSSEDRQDANPGPRFVRAATPTGGILTLEIAASPEERARGMMGRAEVPPGTGMLFTFPSPDRYSFWMFQCLTALDIIWLDGEMRVVDVARAVPPCSRRPCPSYLPKSEALYVVELGPHQAEALGLVEGAALFVDPLPPSPPS